MRLTIGKTRSGEIPNLKMRLAILVFSIFTPFGVIPEAAGSQSLAIEGDALSGAASTTYVAPVSDYARPTHRALVTNYIFDTYGPFAVGSSAVSAGIDQFNNAPPEWKQGAEGYGKRLGSDFGMAAIATTSRYAISEIFKQDPLYYRCECSGISPRLRHAVISTFTTRRGQDGHRAFSFPALAAPYVGATAAVYGWYPSRYGAKDALRMGNYSLLTSLGGYIALEFIYSGPYSLISRMHVRKLHGARPNGPDQ